LQFRHFRRKKSANGKEKEKDVALNEELEAEESPSSSSFTLALRQKNQPPRSLTLRSALSNQLPDDPNLALRQTQRAADRHCDPLGISVLHTPLDGLPPAIDIIFVHGLGGTSRHTWSYNRDLQFFWPKEWLPQEPGFAQTRIFSFGYNADFMSQGPANSLNITNFAQDMLLQMKTVTDENVQALNIGTVCQIIFVLRCNPLMQASILSYS
jgi:hypothetical protein